MIQRWNVSVALTLLALLCAPAGLRAQSGTGTIQGTLEDATSAAIPSASVQALNQAPGVVIDTATNAADFYAIKGLFAGTYTVTFSAPGMKRSESTVTLQNSQVLVFNRQLAVGDMAEKVTVTGET